MSASMTVLNSSWSWRRLMNDYANPLVTITILLVVGIALSFMALMTDNASDTLSPPEPVAKVIAVNEVLPEVSAPPVDQNELRCLALNVYYEARNDSYAGKYAVADVVLNRTENNRYPSTICEVVMDAQMAENWQGDIVPIKHKCQFSWYCDGKPDTPTNELAWNESLIIAKNILTSGKFRGITEGSTHYHALYVTPKWIGDRGMNSTGVIGLHSFYRWD